MDVAAHPVARRRRTRRRRVLPLPHLNGPRMQSHAYRRIVRRRRWRRAGAIAADVVWYAFTTTCVLAALAVVAAAAIALGIAGAIALNTDAFTN